MINTLQVGGFLEFQDYNRIQLKYYWGHKHTNTTLENYGIQELQEVH